jgi:hypothetical protein
MTASFVDFRASVTASVTFSVVVVFRAALLLFLCCVYGTGIQSVADTGVVTVDGVDEVKAAFADLRRAHVPFDIPVSNVV